MRQVFPDIGDVDPVALYLGADRPRPTDRPWLTLGMIASLDGGTAIDGTSGALGGPADKAVFRAVRAIADVIVVAAGTVRAENYRPVHLDDATLSARKALGRRGQPRLAIVTRSLDLDETSDLFRADDPPVVLTTDDADRERVATLASVTEVRHHGTGSVDLAAALSSLVDMGDVVVSEGGPSLNGAIADAAGFDELTLSFSPTLVAGDSPRIVAGGTTRADRYRLANLLVEDDLVFGRYVRRAG